MRVFSPRSISVHEIANCSPNGAYGYICVWYDFLYFHYARVSESVCVPEPRVQCWYAAYFLCWQRESIFIKWLMFLFLQEKNKKRWKNRHRCRKWQRSKYWSLQVCSQKLKICLHVPSWLCFSVTLTRSSGLTFSQGRKWFGRRKKSNSKDVATPRSHS